MQELRDAGAHRGKGRIMNRMYYGSYGDMWRRVIDMARRMPDVDGISGVPVSGLAPAGMLSAATGIPCFPIGDVPAEIKRLLVIEDASGYARFVAQKLGAATDREVKYGAVYACDCASETLDLVGCIVPKPRIFTWNLFKSNRCNRIAYDMDGVLCRDPRIDQIGNYGDRYKQFMKNAEPLRRVKSRLGWIVTGRTESDREETASWLDRNGIRYGELIMATCRARNMEERAQHKSQWYKAHPECLLFVESNGKQASRIAEITGRAVICSSDERSWNTAPAFPAATKPPPFRHDRIIYAISTGGYAVTAPHEYEPPEGWDYRTVTDADLPEYVMSLTPKQRAAWAKIHPHLLFPDHDASLCIDDDMTVMRDPTPLFGGCDMAAMVRESSATWREDLRLVAMVRRAADTDKIEAEIKRLHGIGIRDSRNWMSGVIWRRNVDNVKILSDEWWRWYTESETQRDQPSLAVACQTTGYEPRSITETDMYTYIHHDTRKADRDGVRHYTGGPQNKPKSKTRRKGDRL